MKRHYHFCLPCGHPWSCRADDCMEGTVKPCLRHTPRKGVAPFRELEAIAAAVLCWLALSCAPAALASTPKPLPGGKIPFRVRSADPTQVVMQPVYPVVMHFEPLEGSSLPKPGEMLLCSILRTVVAVDVDGQQYRVYRNVYDCGEGKRFQSVGVDLGAQK